MMRCSLLVIGLGGLVAACGPATRMDPPKMPATSDVLVIVTDDQRADAIGAAGNPVIRTPNLDSLAARGTMMTRAYMMGSDSEAVCAPSRAMILSGRPYIDLPPRFCAPWRGPSAAGSRDPVTTLPEIFRRTGYRTFATGKWHQPREDFRRGFTDARGVFFGGMGSHTELRVHDFDANGDYPPETSRPIGAFSSEAFADAFIGFLDEDLEATDAYFAWVSFTAPHDPRTPPTSYRDLYRDESIPLPPSFLPEHPFDNGELDVRDEQLSPRPRTPADVRRHLADYYAMVTHLDAQIGRIIEALRRRGRLERTIIVVVSDNGLALGSHGLLGKQNLYEHSARCPFILAGPGIARGREVDALVYLHDLLPTLADLAGLETPPAVRGRSLVPLVAPTANADTWPARRSLLLAYRDVQRAIVQRRWKLIAYPKAGVLQLFDLEQDPFETNNQVEAQPEKAQELLGEMARLMETMSDPLPAGALPSPPLVSMP